MLNSLENRVPGTYVAVIETVNGRKKAIEFVFPAVGTFGLATEHYFEMGVDAGWYYLNRLDLSNVLVAVYPKSMFDNMQTIQQ